MPPTPTPAPQSPAPSASLVIRRHSYGAAATPAEEALEALEALHAQLAALDALAVRADDLSADLAPEVSGSLCDGLSDLRALADEMATAIAAQTRVAA